MDQREDKNNLKIDDNNNNSNMTNNLNGRDLKPDDFESELSYLQDRMMKFKHELINEITYKSEKFKQEIELMLNRNKFQFTGTEKSIASSAKIKHGSGIQEKVFEHRESLLTELFKISHIRTFRHIFITLLIIICVQILIYDYTTHGKINLDFDLFWWSFTDLPRTMTRVWLPMQLASLFLVYHVFKFWAELNGSRRSILIDLIFTLMYLSYLSLLIFVPLIGIHNYSTVCRIIILMEQVRILMKSHAFVRSNVQKVLKHSNVSDKNDSSKPKSSGCPGFSKYLYFMFAPTLVYRDEYPRTKKVDWKLVITYFAEIIAAIIYTYCLFDRFCVPVFRSVKVKQLDFNSYLHLISISILPGALIQVMIFFSFLHCWHNAWAEMLRFGDRQFYLDWWNSTSFNTYYRTWNTLVQDWLYNYIYIDFLKIFGKKYRPLSQFAVIFISSIFHEHILSFAFGFFYPIMFVLFSGIGFICMFIPRGSSAPWNVFIWVSLFTGIGIQLCLFSIEYYAREQCARKINSIVDYFVPRSIMCSE